LEKQDGRETVCRFAHTKRSIVLNQIQ